MKHHFIYLAFVVSLNYECCEFSCSHNYLHLYRSRLARLSLYSNLFPSIYLETWKTSSPSFETLIKFLPCQVTVALSSSLSRILIGCSQKSQHILLTGAFHRGSSVFASWLTPQWILWEKKQILHVK